MYGKATKWNNISNIEINFWAMFCWHCRFHSNNNSRIFSKSSYTKYSSVLTGYTVVFTLAVFEMQCSKHFESPKMSFSLFVFEWSKMLVYSAGKTHIYIPSLKCGSILSIVVKKKWQATFVITHFSILTQKICLLVWAQKSVFFLKPLFINRLDIF